MSEEQATEQEMISETAEDELRERFATAMERIGEIGGEAAEWGSAFGRYFERVSGFLLLVDEQRRFLEAGGLKTAPVEELSRRNAALYAEQAEDGYAGSFLNPVVAVRELGEDYGRILSYLFAELQSMIWLTHAGRLEDLVIRLEVFLEVYAAFAYRREEDGQLPDCEEIRQILYWFLNDYADISALRNVRDMVVPEGNFSVELIRNADLSDLRYLYAYGSYIGENETEAARFLNALPEETIRTMADTYTEGYRLGFAATGKDLSVKTTAEIVYPIGFERMMRRALDNLEKMGLRVVCRRGQFSLLGCSTGNVPCNRQLEYDHKEDRALFFDRQYVNRKLEVMRTAFERYKREARGYAGPAVVETFGERDFDPVNHAEAVKLSKEQNKLWVEYFSRNREQQKRYLIEEEQSYTIIAFPVPEIREALPEHTMECYREFFGEIIRVNTLDYQRYRRIQQTMIDALDRADTCEVRGMNGNRTDLVVNLYKLKDPARETIFENCVADVNIPVGEVFTSPVLRGTRGVLHVGKVFLDGLAFRDLELCFEDGRISRYDCKNFETEEENRSFIEENILHRHETLPMGEFAIGTNTTAYTVARKYGVEAKLPILIAEKTGPHFAVGDTCYSDEEDMVTYNPDGKAIVARENEVSALRRTDRAKAYLNCHTDITIPYDELGELTAVTADGERIPIILEGRFVLPGTEELNEALNH